MGADLEKYAKMPNAEVPEDIAKTLEGPGGITSLEFEEKDRVLEDESLQRETGYMRMPSGDLLVAMYCPMPGVTREMIDWWFWWHPQADERYQLWFPGEHFKIKTDKKDSDYFSAEKQPPFRPNSQYPTEKIGNMKMPLRIDFETPEGFGFSPELMEKARVATVVCGKVGAFGGMIYHTEMSHVYFQREDGLFMVSRFWIGKLLKNGLIRKAILTDGTAKGMATHCCIEYRNLAAKLPGLYAEENGGT